jgi:hypothetical protein
MRATVYQIIANGNIIESEVTGYNAARRIAKARGGVIQKIGVYTRGKVTYS